MTAHPAEDDASVQLPLLLWTVTTKCGFVDLCARARVAVIPVLAVAPRSGARGDERLRRLKPRTQALIGGQVDRTIRVMTAHATVRNCPATPLGKEQAMALWPQITTKPVMTDQDASAVLRAAEAKAIESGAAMVIAVVDDAGLLKAFVRMDGTPNGAIQWTIDKAVTAASFRAPTHMLAEGVQGLPAVLASMISRPHVNLTLGGFPLSLGGAVVGAIGAGGGTPEQHQAVAEAGVAALDES